MTKNSGRSQLLALFLIAFSSCFASLPTVSAQDATQSRPDSLPDAPGADISGQQAGTPPPQHEDPQQKRIFGIMPNFRAVSAGTHLPPQTVKEKFVTASEDSFDYSAFVLAALVSVESYATSGTPEFGTGWVGYGRYYWHTLVDQTSENYLVEFFVPVATHEDTRFYSLGKGGFSKRLGYSITRAFITRTDSGRPTFNASEIFGAGISAGISNLYYPTPERTFKNTAEKWAVSVAIDDISFVVKEFYPDINHKLFHKKTDVMATPTP